MSYRLSNPLDSYETSEAILEEVNDALQKGSSPPVLTVREFLSWFGAQRRGPNIVAWINDLLSKYTLYTNPDYTNTYIDDEITVDTITPTQGALNEPEHQQVELRDPVLRIGSLKSANRSPLSVAPDDTLSHAITLMMSNDYSQLPVLTTPREIKGVISWKSIGERLASNVSGRAVRDFMELPAIVYFEDSFFNTLRHIIDNQYVLVRGKDNSLSGIVTTTDLSAQFLQLTEPFLLLNEIENHVRILLQRWANLSHSAVINICNLPENYQNIFDLSFGDYLRIMQSELINEPFPLNIDRKEFCNLIDRVREIRNDVMHFSADPTPQDSILTLRQASQYLQKLQAISQ